MDHCLCRAPDLWVLNGQLEAHEALQLPTNPKRMRTFLKGGSVAFGKFSKKLIPKRDRELLYYSEKKGQEKTHEDRGSREETKDGQDREMEDKLGQEGMGKMVTGAAPGPACSHPMPPAESSPQCSRLTGHNVAQGRLSKQQAVAPSSARGSPYHCHSHPPAPSSGIPTWEAGWTR